MIRSAALVVSACAAVVTRHVREAAAEVTEVLKRAGADLGPRAHAANVDQATVLRAARAAFDAVRAVQEREQAGQVNRTVLDPWTQQPAAYHERVVAEVQKVHVGARPTLDLTSNALRAFEETAKAVLQGARRPN